MQTLVVDVQGEYGQFKKPYSPASPVTYPFPPPTAVLGILGAILGYSKDSYHERLGWQTLRIGVGVRVPVRILRAAINLLQTKDGTDAFFRPRAGQNTHTQVPFEFLKAPPHHRLCYRLYVAGLKEEIAQNLADSLRAGRTVYTVSLGLAPCIADVEWVGEWEAKPLNGETWSAVTVVPLAENLTINYEDGRRYHRLRVPAVMDSNRVVHRYQEVVVAEDAQPIRGQGGNNLFFEVNHDTIAFL